MNLAVGLDMVFGSLFGMFQRARVMAVSQMSVVARSLVETLIMMTGGFAMMTRSVLVVLRCLPVMVRCFFRHGAFLSWCRLVAAREDYGPFAIRRGLQACECCMNLVHVFQGTEHRMFPGDFEFPVKLRSG